MTLTLLKSQKLAALFDAYHIPLIQKLALFDFQVTTTDWKIILIKNLVHTHVQHTSDPILAWMGISDTTGKPRIDHPRWKPRGESPEFTWSLSFRGYPMILNCLWRTLDKPAYERMCRGRAHRVFGAAKTSCKSFYLKYTISSWCHVVGVTCSPDLYALPRALPNVRERGTLPTDGTLHVPKIPPSQQSHISHSQHISQAMGGPSHTCGQPHCFMETWPMCLPKSLKICISLSRTWAGAVMGNVDGRRRPWPKTCGKANWLWRRGPLLLQHLIIMSCQARRLLGISRQGVVIPFTTYTHTLRHMYHPRCQNCLWVLRKSDTNEARVHRR